jgi:NitT/TauT family transport system substrate-binding protein
MRRSSIGVTVSLAAALSLSVAGCSSSGGSTTTAAAGSGNSAPMVTVTLAAVNYPQQQTYLSLVLAEQLGYFTKQGVNVKVTTTASGNQAWLDTLSHSVDGAVGFYDHNQDLRAKGTSTESVINLNQAPGMVELVRTNEDTTITSPAQESGKTIGVTGLGSSTEFLAEYLAVHNGVPLSDLHPVNVGAGAPFVKAMQNDEIDVGLTTEPMISSILAQKAGKIIVDMRSLSGTEAALGGPYPGTSLSFEDSWITANKTTVQKVVNALVEALHYIQTHSAAEITSVLAPADFGTETKAQYEESLANEIGMFNPTGLMPTDGPQSVNRVLNTFDTNVQGKTINLSLTYTDAFVQAAAASTSAN